MIISSNVFFYAYKDNINTLKQYISCISEVYPIDSHPNVLIVPMDKDVKVEDILEKYKINLKGEKTSIPPGEYEQTTQTVLEIVEPLLNENLDKLKKILPGNYKWKHEEVKEINTARYKLEATKNKMISINCRQVYYLPCISLYKSGDKNYLFVSYSAFHRLQNKASIYLVNPLAKKLLHKFALENNVVLMNASFESENDLHLGFAFYLANTIILLKSKRPSCESYIDKLKKKYPFALRKPVINLVFNDKESTSRSISNIYNIKGPKLITTLEEVLTKKNDISDSYKNESVEMLNDLIKKMMLSMFKNYIKIIKGSDAVLFNIILRMLRCMKLLLMLFMVRSIKSNLTFN